MSEPPAARSAGVVTESPFVVPGKSLSPVLQIVKKNQCGAGLGPTATLVDGGLRREGAVEEALVAARLSPHVVDEPRLSG